jgi:hypothetical protein
VSLVLPLIAWGAAENIKTGPGWSDIGTPVVTDLQADPFGGTGAFLVDDNDAAASEARRKTLGAYNSDRMLVGFMNKANTAAASDFIVVDQTAGFITKLQVRSTWGGGVPAVTIVTGGANATLHGTVGLGASYYFTLASIVGLTAGNVHDIRCYGAVPGGVAVGSTYWYLRNLVLLDAVDEGRAWRTPRDGSKKVRARSGIFDSHIKGWDYRFRGKTNWVPSRPRSFPTIVSGYEGLNESIGVNCGVSAMLQAGQDSQSLLWVPDRSQSAVNIASELVEPFDDPYEIANASGDRTFPLALRNTTTPYPTVL